MDEKLTNQKYIKILDSDFLKITSTRSGNSYFRSLEAYLRRNNRIYNIDGKSCTVDVYDKNDAMSIGLYFGLHHIKYFDGLELLSLVLTPKEKNRGRPKNIIIDNTGKKITLKKLREQSSEDIKKHCLEKKEIIKRMILTRESLKNAITKGKLTPIIIGSKYYIDRQELAKFIKNEIM
ncbi:MAG: hypothetical protein V1649_01875 [Patescibacteria group bacterium]